MLKNLYIPIFLSFLVINDLHSTTLNEAINLLYENNNQLRSEKVKIKEVKSAAGATMLNILPDIRYTKSLYQHSTWITLNGVHHSDSRRNRDKTVLSLQEELSVGNLALDPLRAVNILNIQRLNYRLNEQTIILQAISAYLNVIRDEEISRVAKENEDILTKYTGLIKRRLDFGEVTKTDLEQSKSRLYLIQSSRIQAESDFEVSKALYKKTFGIAPKNLTIPKKFPEVPKDLDEFRKITQDQNIPLQISELNKLTAKYDIGRAANAILPSVYIYGTVVKNDDNLIADHIREQRIYGVDLKIPILPRGGSEYAKILQNKYAFNRSYYDYEDYKLDLEKQIIETWNNLKTYNASVESAKSALEFTTLAMNAVKREAQYGSRTTLDVLNSELENFNANVNLIKARYAQILSHYKLTSLMGELNRNVFNN